MPENRYLFQMRNGEAVPLPSGGGPAPHIVARVKALENRFDPEGRPIALSLATADAPGIVRVGQGLSITVAAPGNSETEDSPRTGEVDPDDAVGQDTGISPASEADLSEGALENASEDAPEDAGADEGNPEPGDETPGVLSLGLHASADPALYGKGDSLNYGHVRIVDNFEEELGAADGVALSPKGVKLAWNRLFGLTEDITFTISGSWTVPETGKYTVTCVGGGGRGGTGGTGYRSDDFAYLRSGGGGGGGGSGQVVTRKVTLNKGAVITFTVGGEGGTTTFDTVSALGGGTGGTGGSGIGNGSGGPGGTPGISYSGPANAGSNGTYVNGAGSGASIAGGAGGLGGVTPYSPYGDGGNGGRGGTASTSGGYSGASGAPGNQGCIIIESPISVE